MHSCLSIPELLRKISFNIRNYSQGLTRREEYDLLAIAHTCRAFREPALDALWYRVDGIHWLLRCLGPEDENEPCHKSVNSDRGNLIASSRVSMLRSYAKRIRQMKDGGLHQYLRSWGRPDVPVGLYSAAGGLTLLPNVRLLTLHIEYPFSKFQLFSGPLLENLNLDIRRSEGDDTHLVSLITNITSERFPLLTALALRIDGPLEDPETIALRNMIHETPSITVLAIMHLPQGMLDNLARHPCLRELSFEIPESHQAMASPSGMGTLTPSGIKRFASLESIRIRCSRISDSFEFFENALSPEAKLNVVELEVNSNAANCSSGGKWEKLLQLLLERISPKTLTDLTLKEFTYPEYYSPQNIQGGTLTLLTKFSRLSKLHWTPVQGFDLTDQLLEALAKEWAQMESLTLLPTQDCDDALSLPAPEVTGQGLISLVHYCPLLKHLGLEWDARSVPPLPHPGRRAQVDVEVLDVGRSPIESLYDESLTVLETAAFLTDIFPRLETIVSEGIHDMEVSNDMWDRVMSSIPILNAVRARERTRFGLGGVGKENICP